MLLLLLPAWAGFKAPADALSLDLLVVVILTALGFHLWSAYLDRQLNQEWSETKAWQVQNRRIGMLTFWLCLVWALILLRLLLWLR